MNEARQLRKAFRKKQYRHAYVSAQIRHLLPSQIRLMREDRGWSQIEFGKKLGASQPFVSKLEGHDYDQYSLSTLKKLASTFDVALLVQFVPFSEIIDRTSKLRPHALAVPGFNEDSELDYEKPSIVSIMEATRPTFATTDIGVGTTDRVGTEATTLRLVSSGR